MQLSVATPPCPRAKRRWTSPLELSPQRVSLSLARSTFLRNAGAMEVDNQDMGVS